MQYILGVRPTPEGLRIDPCIPSDWSGFRMERTFRGKKLTIEVQNPDGKCKGVRKLTLNGKDLDGNLIPMEKLQDDNTVVCELG